MKNHDVQHRILGTKHNLLRTPAGVADTGVRMWFGASSPTQVTTVPTGRYRSVLRMPVFVICLHWWSDEYKKNPITRQTLLSLAHA
eukprot:960409-Pelagomonas_calceolata.AAC.8